MSDFHAPRAPLFRRFAAMLYETLLLAALLFIADYLFITLTRALHPPRVILQAWLFLVMGVYFGWMWRKGQSLAMKTWRIRLERRNGGRPGVVQAGLRFVFAFFLLGLSQLWAFVDADRQFLHDRLAGTRLVDAR